MLTYCPARTCSIPVHLITSSFRTETIIFPPILRKTSPITTGRSPAFLSKNIKRQAKKASIV